jgi:microcystin-dependent protein
MATPNIVPRGNGEGGIGTNEKFWKNGYFENLYTRDGAVATESHVQQKIEEHNSAAPVHAANIASKAEAEAGTDTSKFMTPARTREAMQAFVGGDLTGMIFAFAGSTIPSSYLVCDGSAISRTTYAQLYAVIGNTYGAGDGSTTFNVPNLKGRYIEGQNNAAVGKVWEAGLPNITGRLCSQMFSNKNDIEGGLKDNLDYWTGALNTHVWSTITIGYNSYSGGDSYGGQVRFDASKSNAIYGKAGTVQPPAVTMRYIIKY